MSFRVQSPVAAAELQNNTTRIYFAILKAAWQKSRRDFFDKLPPALPGALLAKHLPSRKLRREEKCNITLLDSIKKPVRFAHYGARRRRAPRLVQNLTRLRRYEKPTAFHEILV